MSLFFSVCEEEKLHWDCKGRDQKITLAIGSFVKRLFGSHPFQKQSASRKALYCRANHFLSRERAVSHIEAPF